MRVRAHNITEVETSKEQTSREDMGHVSRNHQGHPSDSREPQEEHSNTEQSTLTSGLGQFSAREPHDTHPAHCRQLRTTFRPGEASHAR